MASLFVRKENYGWRVIEESYENGKRKQLTVPKNAYTSLGINPDWQLDEVRVRVKALNASDQLKSKKVRSAVNVINLSKADLVYLPKKLVEQFKLDITNKSFGSTQHVARLRSHWNFVGTMLIKLRIEPADYFSNKEQIYKYFIDRHDSPDYTNKILRILNQWGEFVCRERAQYFRPVPKPRGVVRSKIEESYLDSTKLRKESDPLTPEILEKCKSQFANAAHFNWLYISVWFGLRPGEIDKLQIVKNWKYENNTLYIYQSKLTALPRDQRWKGIPIVYEEQRLALWLIQIQEFKRPLMKTIKRIFPGRITLYGGRKGFVDLMLNKGQSLEDISMWLGHQSIDTTWRKYRNRKRVSFKAS